jgi:hypothetical protein
VADHDFIPPDAPRAYPYGIYDLKANSGFVNVGTDHDTSGFAVASLRDFPFSSSPARNRAGIQGTIIIRLLVS